MKLTDLAIDRSTTVIISLILIVVAGVTSYVSLLPRESFPEVEIPFVIVAVTYEGVSPSDMESLVTIPIEKKLTGISGIKTISSTSTQGAAAMTIEFLPDEDMTEAIQRVRDRVDLAKSDLPPEADDPLVQEAIFSDVPIVLVNLTGPAGLAMLTELAKDLEDEIEAIPGVFEVGMLGDIEREIQIEVDPVRVANYGVSLTELIQLAMSENANTPAGTMELGEGRYSMRVPGEIKDMTDLNDLVVRRGETGVVYLRDLATVTDGYKPVTTLSRLDGESCVTLSITKRAGENIITVVERVKAAVDEARQRLPRGVSIVLTADQSEQVRLRVEGLENSIVTGLVLVCIVLCIFLGLMNAVFVSMAIPVSLMITATVMVAMGSTLNMITLFSLMVSLGMLVDNGIVVIENIHRHSEMGKDRVLAAKDGTREVAWPIFASTVTTIAAFFPMIFWPTIMGKFMNLLPKTVIIALLASLFVGLIVNPALASVFLGRKKRNRVREDLSTRKHLVLDAYAAVLRLTLRWRAVTVVLAAASLVVITAVYSSTMRYNFMPDTEPEQASINITGPEGARLEATDMIARQIEGFVEPHSAALEYFVTNVGMRGMASGDPGPPLDFGAETTHLGSVLLDFPVHKEMEVLPSDIIEEIRAQLRKVTGAEVRISKMTMGPPIGAAVNIELTGDDYAVLEPLTEEIKRRIQDVPDLVDLEDNLDKGKPEIRVIVDREQARLANLTTQFIGVTVQAAVNGRKAGEYRVGDEEYDVIVRFPEAFRKDLSNIESMDLINLAGEAIPFSAVARVELVDGFGNIKHKNRKRTVTISASAEGGKTGPQVLAEVQRRLSDLPLPTGYAISYTGENQDIVDTTKFLSAAFVVAMLLITIILITQFNSIIQAFVIMSSVILSLGGVFLGLFIFQMPFSVLMSGIGCVSLAGIVVNNAIVMVDFINKLRAQGMAVAEAIVLAGRIRFRPVLLTAVTTILGLIPLGVGISFDIRRFEWVVGGSTAEFWAPLAVAIIFGLAFATVLTLVIVPVLYSLGASLTEFLSPTKGRDAARAESESVPITK